MYYKTNELYHHSILGQKWGVRRYQNEDGSLTPAGKKRYGYDINTAKAKYTNAKNEYKDAKRAYNLKPSKSNSEMYLKQQYKKEYAKKQIQNERIKDALNRQKNKSKTQIQYEEKYKMSGMSDEEAAIAAYKRARTEKALVIAAGVSVAAIASYAAYKYYDKNIDKIIKPNTLIQNISSHSDKGIEDAFYFSMNKMDKLKYKGVYGNFILSNGKKVYDTQILTNKPIKVASQKSAVKALQELVNNDKTYAVQLKEYFGKSEQFYQVPQVNAIITKGYEKLKAGIIDNDVYEALNVTLADHTRPNSDKIAKGFYDKLKRAGYDAIADINDKKYSGYYSRNPIIGFNISDKATISKIAEVGEKEIKAKNIIGTADSILIANIPSAVEIAGITAVSNAIGKRNYNMHNQKIVRDYKEKHPDTKLTSKEIIENYYSY